MTIAAIRAAWNRYFHEPMAATTLGVYRILYGWLLVSYGVMIFPDLVMWFGRRGVLPYGRALQTPAGRSLDVLQWLPHTDLVMMICFWVFMAAALCVMIGWKTRIASIVSFVLLVSFHHRNTTIVNSGDSFMRIAGFWLMFADAGRAFSVDRFIRIARGKENGEAKMVSPWPLRMIALQVCFLYADAFLWKIRGDQWMSGLALYYSSRLLEFYRFPTPYILDHLWTLKLMTHGTLVVEFGLGFLLWVKDLRYWILLAGLLLHLGIGWTMNIPLFGWILTTAYVAWIAPADLERFFAWVRERINRWTHFTAPIPVFYDGKCSFCARSVAVIRRLDALRRIRFIDMHAQEARAEFPDLDLDRGANEMLLRGRDGEWYGGFDAYRVMARHMPILWFALPLLFIPPVPAIGRRIYARIAGRRYCLLAPLGQPQTMAAMGK